MQFIFLNTNHFRNYIESETNCKDLLHKSFWHLPTQTHFEFRIQKFIICYTFTWDRLMASWLMDHEAIEPMPKLLLRIPIGYDTVGFWARRTQKQIIICQQILYILIIICSHPMPWSTIIFSICSSFARSFTGKLLILPLTNRTVQVFVLVYKLNGIHFCTLAKNHQIRNTQNTCEKNTKPFQMKEKEENKSKFGRVIFVWQTLQTEKFTVFEFVCKSFKLFSGFLSFSVRFD